MGFKNNGFAKVWEVIPRKTDEQKYCDIKISTSKRNRSTGTFETDFSSICRCIGKALSSAISLTGTERIKLLEVETTHKYDKAKGKTFTNFIIWDFETQDSVYKSENPSHGSTEKQEQQNMNDFIKPAELTKYEDDGDELPF